MSVNPGSQPSPPLYALVDTEGRPPVPVMVPIVHAHQNSLRPPPTHSTSSVASHAPSSQSLKQFDFKAESRGRTIGVLTLTSSLAHSKELATFLGREPITGNVRLQLDKPTVVKSITVSVPLLNLTLPVFKIGLVWASQITGRCKPKDRSGTDNLFDEDTTFLDISHTIWAHDSKDRRGGTHRGNQSVSVDSNGKLHGEYSWSFAIDLPSAVVAPTSSGSVAFASPQKLKEDYYAMAVYTLSVRIQREWSSPDHKIKATFGYIPVIWPPPPPIPGYMVPEGRAVSLASSVERDKWYSLSPLRIQGTIFRTHRFEVNCTLFIAKPLNYSRGSLIPLCIRLTSQDRQALDVIASPRSIVVRLRRRGALSTLSSKSRGPSSHIIPALRALGGDSDSQPLEVAEATWLSSTESNDEGSAMNEHVRYIIGELDVDKALKPSSTKVEYSVVLYPFVASELELAGIQRDAIIQEQLVDISDSLC